MGAQEPLFRVFITYHRSGLVTDCSPETGSSGLAGEPDRTRRTRPVIEIGPLQREIRLLGGNAGQRRLYFQSQAS